jgi:hypothetical protein
MLLARESSLPGGLNRKPGPLGVSGHGTFYGRNQKLIFAEQSSQATIVRVLQPTELALPCAPSLSLADGTVDVILLGIQIFLGMMDFS